MFISFAVGAFAMFLFHLNDSVPENKKQNKADKAVVQKKSKVIEPTFDFYTLLPEMEVVVESPKQAAQKQIVTSPPQTTPNDTKKTTQESYMIQVGSFKKAVDADGFRARLALLGIESKVQTVTIDDKDTWHRVQVGPISGRDSADKLQKQLKQNSIDSLLMRARHG
jgi:cell division protein FtsN